MELRIGCKCPKFEEICEVFTWRSCKFASSVKVNVRTCINNDVEEIRLLMQAEIDEVPHSRSGFPHFTLISRRGQSILSFQFGF